MRYIEDYIQFMITKGKMGYSYREYNNMIENG